MRARAGSDCADSGLTGGGLNSGLPANDTITSPPDNAVHNIIIQNLNFDDWADDAINVQIYSHHIWVDHNTFVGARQCLSRPRFANGTTARPPR